MQAYLANPKFRHQLFPAGREALVLELLLMKIVNTKESFANGGISSGGAKVIKAVASFTKSLITVSFFPRYET